MSVDGGRGGAPYLDVLAPDGGVAEPVPQLQQAVPARRHELRQRRVRRQPPQLVHVPCVTYINYKCYKAVSPARRRAGRPAAATAHISELCYRALRAAEQHVRSARRAAPPLLFKVLNLIITKTTFKMTSHYNNSLLAFVRVVSTYYKF